MLRCVLALTLSCVAVFTFAQGKSAPEAADPVPEPVVAGTVNLVEGDVRFFDRNKRIRRPRPGDRLYEGDSIETGSNGETHLDMEDGGYMGVRPNTRMSVLNYKAEGEEDDQSIIGLLQGSFRSVTGWIAKLGGNRYTVRAGTATIGVRGTEHEPLVIPEGSQEGEPGTYDRVHIGETTMRTAQGEVNVRPNQAGFVPHSGAIRPRVLDRVPGFFRATRNEARFDGMHERVQAQLEKRRDERRHFIEQRHKQRIERRKDHKAAVERRQEHRQELRKEQAGKAERNAEGQKVQEERRRKIDETKREREKKQRKVQQRQREAAEKKAAQRAAKTRQREEQERAKRTHKAE
jgi:hypothetical protein